MEESLAYKLTAWINQLSGMIMLERSVYLLTYMCFNSVSSVHSYFFESAVFKMFVFINLVITAVLHALGTIWTKFMEDLPIYGTRLGSNVWEPLDKF